MSTSFDAVIDLANIKVNDYKLVKLYEQNPEGFKKWCDGLLISAIPNFLHCKNNLAYDAERREFVSELTNEEISILVDLWCIEWFTRETHNSAKINAKLQTSGGFKNHSESQNLKEKSMYLDGMREKVRQKMIDYQLNNITDINI